MYQIKYFMLNSGKKQYTILLNNKVIIITKNYLEVLQYIKINEKI